MQMSMRNAGEENPWSNLEEPDPHTGGVTHFVRMAEVVKQNLWVKWVGSHCSELYQQSNGRSNTEGGQSQNGGEKGELLTPVGLTIQEEQKTISLLWAPQLLLNFILFLMLLPQHSNYVVISMTLLIIISNMVCHDKFQLLSHLYSVHCLTKQVRS